jgi:hypothetical protein
MFFPSFLFSSFSDDSSFLRNDESDFAKNLRTTPSVAGDQ